MSMGLLGKVAIVSGGGSGIGAETAKIIAGAGASVVWSDISLLAAEAIADEIARGGGKAAAFGANVATVEFAKKTFGGLHLAFNNAGLVGPEQPIQAS